MQTSSTFCKVGRATSSRMTSMDGIEWSTHVLLAGEANRKRIGRTTCRVACRPYCLPNAELSSSRTCTQRTRWGGTLRERFMSGVPATHMHACFQWIAERSVQQPIANVAVWACVVPAPSESLPFCTLRPAPQPLSRPPSASSGSWRGTSTTPSARASGRSSKRRSGH